MDGCKLIKWEHDLSKSSLATNKNDLLKLQLMYAHNPPLEPPPCTWNKPIKILGKKKIQGKKEKKL